MFKTKVAFLEDRLFSSNQGFLKTFQIVLIGWIKASPPKSHFGFDHVNWLTFLHSLKGELGELEFYFRKTSLHQQKFLVASVLSNSPWLPRNLKNRPK